MSTLECPYCNHRQDADHDDGYGFTEDRAHDMSCEECRKKFVFYTSITYNYETHKADCLNGSPHDFQTVIKMFGEQNIERCTMCEEERPCRN